MAVILKFDTGLKSGSNQTVDRNYIIFASGDADAYAQLVASDDCPVTLPGATETLYRNDVEVKHAGANVYEAVVSWAAGPTPENAPDEIDVGISFSTTGGQQFVTQSLNTVRYPPSATDHKGQIGVTANGIEGVTITVPQFQWSEEHLIDNSAATSAYRRALMLATGTTNNAVFRTYAVGEVLFLCVSGSRKSASQWSLTFSFMASPNVTGLAIGDIEDIAKGGWDCLWTNSVDSISSADGRLTRTPLGVYVERVYPRTNFGALGIGS